MTTVALRPLDQMTRDWDAQSRSAASRKAFSALAALEPTVAELGAVGIEDLGGLVTSMRPGGDGWHRDRAAAVLRAMLRSQGADPLIARAVLQAVMPGLVSVARRLSWGSGGEWEDGGAFFVDAVTTAWEVIAEWSGDDRPYAVLDLLSAVRCRLRRQLLGHRTRGSRLMPVADPPDLGAGSTCSASDVEELARALDDLVGHGLDADDAAVLYAHRVLGYSLTELSSLTGKSRRNLGDRRDRAVKALTA
jgi:hypothetical protein